MENTVHYVSMEDSFMSGWGQAENKTNVLVFLCSTLEQALIVEENAQNQGSMKKIKVSNKKPQFSPQYNYVQTKTIEDYPKWYEKGLFPKVEWYKEADHIKLINDLRSEYMYEDNVKITKNLTKYVLREEVPVFSTKPFSNNEISLTNVRSALNQMVAMSTDVYKEEELNGYREHVMVQRLEAITVVDHENGIVSIQLHSSSLDYTVEVILNDNSKGGIGYKRGTVVG